MKSSYHKAYEQLGEERHQVVPLLNDVSTEGKGMYLNELDAYWAVRVDNNWSKMPGRYRYLPRTKTRVFMEGVSSCLLQLEPATTFNPVDVWQNELKKLEQQPQEASNNKASKKKDLRIESNTLNKAHTKLVAEVTQIRNSKQNLMDCVRKIETPFAQVILLIQLLASAYEAYEKTKEKKLLYDVYWALEGREIPEKEAPPADPKKLLTKDPSLVYDNYKDVKSLLKKASKVINADSDLIKVQLVEMSDSLPPLSKFTFGFSLDKWQKRVLTWIDSGKSVVISAPTSSGKTVLSSYVAVIFKSAAKDESSNLKKPSAITTGNSAEEDAEREAEELENELEALEADELEAQLSRQTQELKISAGDADKLNANEQDALTHELVREDRLRRIEFLQYRRQLQQTARSQETAAHNVLFVVPTEPLVWQVAAFFTKLLKEQGDKRTRVALCTDQLTFNPQLKLNSMPQIVVGTPVALESALTKCRGLTGYFETRNRASGDTLPGGFDHFDWVIYDEVHALDGKEGAALQRIIRAMNCRFLALSATVGNAEELRAWMERVKGEHLHGVEAINAQDFEQATIPSAEQAFTLNVLAQQVAREQIEQIRQENLSYTITVVNTFPLKKISFTVQSATTTVKELKTFLCEQWPELNAEENIGAVHVQQPIQIYYRGVDLADDNALLVDYHILPTNNNNNNNNNENNNNESAEEILLYVPSRVHILIHQIRFINLQRYMWDPSTPPRRQRASLVKTHTKQIKASLTEQEGSLQLISPLAAVSSVQSLQNGLLRHSSLSFTPADCYRVWEELQRVFSNDVIEFISPYKFFGVRERITLQRTKDYEELLKAGLESLASTHPQEIQRLLDVFQLKDVVQEFDLCELVMNLKAQDLLPCLPFHLNTFDAIRLFQQLLAGLEYRQKRDYPTYITDEKDRINRQNAENKKNEKNTGGNEKVKQELLKSGDLATTMEIKVDEEAPHPEYTFCKGSPISNVELDNLLEEMERNDHFEKRGPDQGNQKGRNIRISRHALIRGLRRGIGLFIEEASFPSYRRAVQRLASHGKLGVVISDGSLAFGVNMPFRTTIFCGEMRGELDELMAQQMAGRAGRRGLDTSGNIIYAGVRTGLLRRLMIGKIANITGEYQNPKYDTLFLQGVLSPRYVGYSRCEVIGGLSLHEFIQAIRTPGNTDEKRRALQEIASNYTMTKSKQAMVDLGFVSATTARDFRPNTERNITYALLATIWELRFTVHESITIGQLFNDILNEFMPDLEKITMNERKQNSELTEQFVLAFCSVLVTLVGRTPWRESIHGSTCRPMKLSELSYFQLPQHHAMRLRWEEIFARQQREIPEEYQHLRDPVVPGTELDGTFFQCILDRSYVHRLDDVRKQDMKQMIWHVGSILKVLSNCTHIEDEYVRISNLIFRPAFAKLKYLNAELICGIVNFENVAEYDKERRTDRPGEAMIPAEAMPWCDLDSRDWGLALGNNHV